MTRLTASVTEPRARIAGLGRQLRARRSGRTSPVRPMVVGFILVLFAWPVLAVHLFTTHSTRLQPQAPAAVVFPRAIDERAQEFLRTYLAAGAGTENTLNAWLPGQQTLTGIPANTVTVNWATTYSVTHTTGDSDYAVVVVSDLSAAGQHIGVRCWQIVLTPTGTTWTALTEPAALACPATTPTDAPQADPLPLTGGDGTMFDTVEHWLTGYLTGSLDPARYTRPGTTLTPLNPPAYQSITLTSLALISGPTATPPVDGSVAHVLVGLTATGPALTTQLTYPLQLTARGQRWEVSGIDHTTNPPTATPTP